MKIEPRHPTLEITKEKYGRYLELSYEEFYDKTLMDGFTDESCFYRYSYCVSKSNDNDTLRLSYLSYLINQKGFDL